jgi:hypothetical protein
MVVCSGGVRMGSEGRIYITKQKGLRFAKIYNTDRYSP